MLSEARKFTPVDLMVVDEVGSCSPSYSFWSHLLPLRLFAIPPLRPLLRWRLYVYRGWKSSQPETQPGIYQNALEQRSRRGVTRQAVLGGIPIRDTYKQRAGVRGDDCEEYAAGGDMVGTYACKQAGMQVGRDLWLG